MALGCLALLYIIAKPRGRTVAPNQIIEYPLAIPPSPISAPRPPNPPTKARLVALSWPPDSCTV